MIILRLLHICSTGLFCDKKLRKKCQTSVAQRKPFKEDRDHEGDRFWKGFDFLTADLVFDKDLTEVVGILYSGS